jgi:hypothetical protein
MKNSILLFGIGLLSLLGFASCEDAEVYERNTYKVNAQYFSIREIPEWTELGTQNLPWGQAFEGMDPNKQGFITSYFRDTVGLSLRNSQVRIEYFSRKLPNCSNNDSVSMYMQKIMSQKYGGLQTQRDSAALETRDGKSVAYVEAVSTLNGIWFAWYYIPLENYYVAMNLSAYSENDYSLMKNKLRQIVESFEETEAEEEIEVE